MIDQLRRLRVRLENAITRAVLDRSDANGRFLQLLWAGDRVSADVEHLEPQGLHVRPPAGASAVLLAPGGSRAGALALGVGADVPADSLEAGEGGLHYLGAYRVFMKANGEVHLGVMNADDFVPCDSKLQTELAAVQSELSALKTILSTHVHSGVTTGGGASGPSASFSSWNVHSPSTTASSRVKVQS